MDAIARTLQGGEYMNHDYAHCLDYSPDCPKECFRGKLIRDLRNNNTSNLSGVQLTWSHLKGTEECKKKEVTT